MAFPKNSKSAFMALLAAGGAWAWQNRDKISGWVDQQRSQRQMGQHRKVPAGIYDSPTPAQHHPANPDAGYSSQQSPTSPYTGSTRRIDENELGTL